MSYGSQQNSMYAVPPRYLSRRSQLSDVVKSVVQLPPMTQSTFTLPNTGVYKVQAFN